MRLILRYFIFLAMSLYTFFYTLLSILYNLLYKPIFYLQTQHIYLYLYMCIYMYIYISVGFYSNTPLL